jgi:hypothetical protein
MDRCNTLTREAAELRAELERTRDERDEAEGANILNRNALKRAKDALRDQVERWGVFACLSPANEEDTTAATCVAREAIEHATRALSGAPLMYPNEDEVTRLRAELERRTAYIDKVRRALQAACPGTGIGDLERIETLASPITSARAEERAAVLDVILVVFGIVDATVEQRIEADRRWAAWLLDRRPQLVPAWPDRACLEGHQHELCPLRQCSYSGARHCWWCHIEPLAAQAAPVAPVESEET